MELTVAEGELGCPESTYRYLQRLRNHLIIAKIEMLNYEREAEEFTKLGWHEEALKLREKANSCLKTIRELEDEILKLEKLCFGKPREQ